MLRKKIALSINFLPAYIMGLLIFVGASIPSSPIEKLQNTHTIFKVIFSDVSLHFFGFALLTFLLCAGFNKQRKYPLPYQKIAFYSLSFGLLIELYQIAIPYRYFSLSDLAFDCVGIGGALILSSRFHFEK
jgi:VanZ family protein